MTWLLIDAENYFDEEQEDYGIKKGSKGIQEHANDIHWNDFLFIYNVSRQQIEQIYIVTEEVYKTDDDDYPLRFGILYIDRLDNPISFEEIKRLLPDSEYVKDSHRRAIGSITSNEFDRLRDHLLENNRRFSELVRLFTE